MIEVIQKPDSVFENLVGFDESKKNKTYRPSMFVIRQDVPEGLLMFHTLTCEMVLVGKEDTDLSSDDYLRSHLFFVPEEMDERTVTKQYRALRRAMDAKNHKDITSYTILPTTDCNARCFYCYEMGCNRIPMSEETAMKVVGLIERNYLNNTSSEKSDVMINWFGGEPLYNSNIIDLICAELQKRSVPYKSKMISNGYLFDEEMVRKAVDLWKLQSVQITLDGTETVYNRAKAFIYKDGSPYQRVIKNIGLLLDADIKVQVRMNIGRHNADDLFNLVHSLADLYSGKKGLNCYAHTLFEESAGTNSVKLSDEGRKFVYEKMEQLETLMQDLGVKPKGGNLPREVKCRECMADRGNSIMISSTGGIGLCEHYSENNFIANIDSPDDVDNSMVEKFREEREEIELCENCPIYPQCIRLKMCEESVLCTIEKITCDVNSTKRTMKLVFEKYKKKTM